MHSILIIEDDHDTRVTLRRTLEAEGYFVFSATNGVDGLALLKRIKPPSLILLDQNLPFMSGDEFLKVKNRDKELAHIPVAVVSAVANRCSEGVFAFIRKPIELGELLDVLRTYCPVEAVGPGLRRNAGVLSAPDEEEFNPKAK